MYIDIDLSLLIPGRLLTMDSERTWPEAKWTSQKRWKEWQKAKGKQETVEREAESQRKEGSGQRKRASSQRERKGRESES